MRPGMKCPVLLLVVGIVLEWFVGIAGPLAQPPQASVVEVVEAVGMTVADMERSAGFYSTVLAFEKVSDVEVTGSAYERLQGVFGLRLRVVRMRLGDEYIELTEYLAPRGRLIPVDTLQGCWSVTRMATPCSC